MGGLTNRQLIVGIDPGTTTALCLFDLEGNLVSLESGKNLSKSDIAKYVQKFGYPVIIASDIFPTPRSIEKIGAAFSSRLIVPDAVVSRKEKTKIVERFVRKAEYKKTPWANKHQRDAFFAALYAWNKIKPLIRRINIKIKEAPEKETQELYDFVKRSVILEKRNISKSIKHFSSEKRK